MGLVVQIFAALKCMDIDLDPSASYVIGSLYHQGCLAIQQVLMLEVSKGFGEERVGKDAGKKDIVPNLWFGVLVRDALSSRVVSKAFSKGRNTFIMSLSS